MKTLKKITLSILFTFCTFYISKAQDILTDSKGNTLFSVPSSSVTPQISGNNVGIVIPVVHIKQIKYYVRQKNDTTKIYTMQKSNIVTFKANLYNNTDDQLIFNKDTKISPHIELGYVFTTIDTVYNADQKKGTYYTLYGSIFTDHQQLDVYDFPSHTIARNGYKKWEPGVKISANIFYHTDWAIALSGSYQHGVNLDNLTSYQKITPDFQSDANVATNGTVDGYLGPVAAKNLFRFSVSFPWFGVHKFIFKKHLSGIQFVPTPYYILSTPISDKLAHNAGVGLSVFNGRFYRQHSSFTFTDSFSIGYNLINSADKSNAKYVFLTGTFSFGASQPKTKDELAQ
jgi:TM2 domain-containing membrane protein YozV